MDTNQRKTLLIKSAKELLLETRELITFVRIHPLSIDLAEKVDAIVPQIRKWLEEEGKG